MWTFSKHHSATDNKLRELKLLIIKYLPLDGLHNNQLTATLHDIYENEAWLRQHAMVEDDIFVPAIRRLEQLNKQSDVARNISDMVFKAGTGQDPDARCTERPRERRYHFIGTGHVKQGDSRPPLYFCEHRYHPSSKHCTKTANPLSCRAHHLRYRQWTR